MITHNIESDSSEMKSLTQHRTIGLLGGLSWLSSLEYYRVINTAVQRELGGLHSANILMVSFDFAQVEALQRIGDWESATQLIVDGALRLKHAGADCLVICSNTMHVMAENVASRVELPLIHIADSTAERIRAQGISRVGLLGTRTTMEKDFYIGRLRTRHNLEVIIPEFEARSEVHRVIFQELCKGEILDQSRVFFQGVISDLARRGAEGVVLGCTEIELLITCSNSPIPIFKTAKIHAEAAARWAMSEILPI
jgi:aspartate racemase